MQLPNLLWLSVFVTLGSVGNIWHTLRSGCLRSNRTFTTVTEVEHELDADGRIDAKPCFSSRALVINLWLRLDAKSSNKIITPQAICCQQAWMFITRLRWKPTWDNEISSSTFCLSVMWLMSDCSSGCVGGDEISRKFVSNDLREASGSLLECVNSSSPNYGKANRCKTGLH